MELDEFLYIQFLELETIAEYSKLRVSENELDVPLVLEMYVCGTQMGESHLVKESRRPGLGSPQGSQEAELTLRAAAQTTRPVVKEA